MQKKWKLLLYCGILLGSINTISIAQRPMTVDDFLNIVSVRNVLLSPNGEHVFYSLEKLNWEKNKHINTHYLCSSDGKDKRIFLREGLEGRRFKFSPDSKYLSFLSKKDKKSQIFLIPLDGGEAQSISDHRVSINDFKWLKNSTGIVFHADEARSENEQKEYDLGSDAVFVDEAPNGKEYARFSRLWFLDLNTKKTSLICKEDLVIEDFDISPDGKRIIFTGTPDTRTNYPFYSELYMIDRTGNDLKQLTHNKGPESNPRWSPDGENIIFHAPYQSIKDGEFELSNGNFWVLSTITGKFRLLNCQRQGEMRRGANAWSPDGKYFYINELHGTNTNLYMIDIEADAIRALTQITGTLQPKSFSADMTKMAYIFQDYKTPADVYIADLSLKKPIRITEANPWHRKDILLSTAKPIRWKSSKDGMEIEGMLYLPPDYENDKKSPLIVHIHGGPAGVVENSYRPEFHIFGGLGYAVLGPNYRGSTGYGDKLLRGLMGEVGDGEHVDIMSGVDFVIENYSIDADQMAVRGWSWGGVSTGYLITHVHRFKAASAGAGVFNWAAETGPGFNFDVSLWYIGGTPWDNPQEWADRSAITHVKNVITPTIIFHGGEDTTSSVNQSLMYFTALRDIGKIPVRYIKFPRQGHGIEEPRLQRIHMIEEIRWFQKYVKEEDWTPWERIEK
jgi:dipeptidyl aminopeptidase/acylaminoacyl peptidase